MKQLWRVWVGRYVNIISQSDQTVEKYLNRPGLSDNTATDWTLQFWDWNIISARAQLMVAIKFYLNI